MKKGTFSWFEIIIDFGRFDCLRNGSCLVPIFVNLLRIYIRDLHLKLTLHLVGLCLVLKSGTFLIIKFINDMRLTTIFLKLFINDVIYFLVGLI